MSGVAETGYEVMRVFARAARTARFGHRVANSPPPVFGTPWAAIRATQSWRRRMSLPERPF